MKMGTREFLRSCATLVDSLLLITRHVLRDGKLRRRGEGRWRYGFDEKALGGARSATELFRGAAVLWGDGVIVGKENAEIEAQFLRRRPWRRALARAIAVLIGQGTTTRSLRFAFLLAQNQRLILSILTARGLLDNDCASWYPCPMRTPYQHEQALAAKAAGAKTGPRSQHSPCNDDSITQSQQLLEIIQSRSDAPPSAFLVEPVTSSGLRRVAEAAVAQNIGW